MDEVEALIKKEHDLILKYLNLLLKQDFVDYVRLVSFCSQFIEDNHHLKEEELIFKKVQDHPRLQEGGPLCVLYFDLHMAYSPVDRAVELSKKLNQAMVFQISPHLKDLYAKKTPLNIPIEEHEAGKFLLSLAEDILAFSSGGSLLENPSAMQGLQLSTEAIDALQQIFKLYTEIQVSHFEKEEGCFLKMVCHITSKEEQDEILANLKSQYLLLQENNIQEFLYG